MPGCCVGPGGGPVIGSVVVQLVEVELRQVGHSERVIVVPREVVEGRVVEIFPVAVGFVTTVVVFISDDVEVATVLLALSFSDSVEFSSSVVLSSSVVASSVVSSTVFSSLVVVSCSVVSSSAEFSFSVVEYSSSVDVSGSEVGSPSVVESFWFTDLVVVSLRLAVTKSF